MTEKCACKGYFLDKLIQPAILSILYEKPNYGYSILNLLTKTQLWKGRKPDPSGLYRMLKSMEQRGLLSSYTTSPDSSSIGKRMFSITDEGIHCMIQWETTLHQYQEGIAEITQKITAIKDGMK